MSEDNLQQFEGMNKDFTLPQLRDIKKSVKTSTTISNNMTSMNNTRSHLNNIL